MKDVLRDPRHPYTKGLLDSAPDFDQPDRELVAIAGFPPNLAARPDGCPFEPRCAFAVEPAPPPGRGWRACCRDTRRPASSPRASLQGASA